MRISTIGLILLVIGAELSITGIYALLATAVPTNGLASHSRNVAEQLFKYLIVLGPTVFIAGAITSVLGVIVGTRRSSESAEPAVPHTRVDGHSKAVAIIHITTGALTIGLAIVISVAEPPVGLSPLLLLLLASIPSAQLLCGVLFLRGSRPAKRALLGFSALMLLYAPPFGAVAGLYSFWALARNTMTNAMSATGER